MATNEDLIKKTIKNLYNVELKSVIKRGDGWDCDGYNSWDDKQLRAFRIKPWKELLIIDSSHIIEPFENTKETLEDEETNSSSMKM